MPTQKKKTRRMIQEMATFAVNQEKWRAADLFCKEHGWQFQILTSVVIYLSTIGQPQIFYGELDQLPLIYIV
jgi:predicted TIM-barrel fold metal-dependent hydrolase